MSNFECQMPISNSNLHPWLEWISRVDDFDIGHLVDPFGVGEIGRVRLRDVAFAMSATQRNERILPVRRSAFRRKTDRQIQISFEENVDFILRSSFRESRFVEFFRKARRVALNRRSVFLRSRTFKIINGPMEREKQGGNFGCAKSVFSASANFPIGRNSVSRVGHNRGFRKIREST